MLITHIYKKYLYNFCSYFQDWQEGIHETGLSNQVALIGACNEYSTCEEFLYASDIARIPIRSCSKLSEEQVTTAYDFDGFVVELHSLLAVKFNIYKLQLKVRKGCYGFLVYSKIKKHLPLSTYHKTTIDILRKIRGISLFSANGWQAILTLIPRAGQRTLQQPEPYAYFKGVERDFISAVERTAKSQIVPGESRVPRTVLKNSLIDVEDWDVLPEDQAFILMLLDRAIISSDCPNGFEPRVYLTRFGQKESGSFNLNSLFVPEHVTSVTFHAGVNLSMPCVNLLWSRTGLQQLVGKRGNLYSCLSLSESANFQTNLDNREMDISAALREVTSFQTGLTFLQFYADTPHRRLESKVPHPVSSLIASCGILHKETQSMLTNSTRLYIAGAGDFVTKFVDTVESRIEIVVKLSDSRMFAQDLMPKEFYNEEKLLDLFCQHPLFVPFAHNGRTSFTQFITATTGYMVSELTKLCITSARKGGFLPTWRAYQLELAIEKVIWGRPQLVSDYKLSRSLGPGSMYIDRSATSQRGFLALSSPTAAALDAESAPPFTALTKKDVQKERLRRIFTFSDLLSGSYAMIGERYLSLLLHDLQCDIPISNLACEDAPFHLKVLGSKDVNSVVETVCKVGPFLTYPAVTQRASYMLRERDLPLQQIIKASVIESGIRFFPNVTLTDGSKNKKIQWNKKDVVEVSRGAQQLSRKGQVATMQADVLSYLLEGEFTFRSNLNLFPNGIPWLDKLLCRLEGAKLSRKQTVLVATFVTIVGLLQNGVYADYRKIKHLLEDLPISQAGLKSRQILSAFYLQKLCGFTIWKLHDNLYANLHLPKKDDNKRKKAASVHQPEEQSEQAEELGQLEDDGAQDDDGTQDVQVVVPMDLPTTYNNRKWQSVELKLLEEIAVERRPASAYRQYITLCRERQVPTRTFRAFERKWYTQKKIVKTATH